MFWNKEKIKDIIKNALQEDLGQGGDITSANLLSTQHLSSGVILAKEQGIICGLEIAELVFAFCNSSLKFESFCEDGSTIKDGQKVAEIKGSTADILTGERTALNFLQRLSAIATTTDKYVKAVAAYPVRITDTRKTTPNLRLLEKYAVATGGGYNHRMGLYDAVMIKDNHIAAVGGIEKAINIIREKVPHTIKIEVEVEDIEGVKEALKAGADIIMLDNMKREEMKKAVNLINREAIVEASGGISLDNIEQVARTGIDIISVGALTHQINSLDISLDLN